MKILALIISLSSACAFASPSWYGEVPLDSTLSYGFGKGNTYQQAKDAAYHDLAKGVENRIVSKTTSTKTFENGELKKSAASHKESISNVVFRNNVTIINSEKSHNQFYVQVQYDPESFAQKLSAWLKKSKCHRELHPYWSTTTMLKNWVEQHQCLPHIDIERFAGGWMLSNSSGQLVLPEAKYNHLFFNYSDESIDIHSSKRRLNAGDHYFIKLNSNQAGYLSLFQVYEDGSTGVLVENHQVTDGDSIEFPDRNKYDGIEALLSDGQETYDTNIALLCPTKIDTSRFERLDESRLSTDTPGFGLILNYFEHCDFVMERLSIEKG